MTCTIALPDRSTARGSRATRLLAAVAAVGACVAVGVGPASAAAGTATGSGGQRLTVSTVSGLDPAKQVVQVDGRGYDTAKGIYVAFCVVPKPGQVPTPCGGGADTTGAAGASAWISSNPPSYGTTLAKPYGAGGTFHVTLTVAAKLDDTIDCRTTPCAVVTRADHTRSSDRSQDVVVPVSFRAPADGGRSPARAFAAGVGGGAIGTLAVLGLVALVRRRRGAGVEESVDA